jgi:hypothetical protein
MNLGDDEKTGDGQSDDSNDEDWEYQDDSFIRGEPPSKRKEQRQEPLRKKDK